MIDQAKIKQGVRLLLEGIGEDISREGLIDTPNRIARMYEELYSGMEDDAGITLSMSLLIRDFRNESKTASSTVIRWIIYWMSPGSPIS